MTRTTPTSFRVAPITTAVSDNNSSILSVEHTGKPTTRSIRVACRKYVGSETAVYKCLEKLRTHAVWRRWEPVLWQTTIHSDVMWRQNVWPLPVPELPDAVVDWLVGKTPDPPGVLLHERVDEADPLFGRLHTRSCLNGLHPHAKGAIQRALNGRRTQCCTLRGRSSLESPVASLAVKLWERHYKSDEPTHQKITKYLELGRFLGIDADVLQRRQLMDLLHRWTNGHAGKPPTNWTIREVREVTLLVSALIDHRGLGLQRLAKELLPPEALDVSQP